MPSFKPLAKSRQKKKILKLDTDEKGRPILTEKFIRDLCESNGQYATPSLNDTLYLHYKGFSKIENLSAYVNLKSIWLECNGIQKIQGLDTLRKLKMIYLHQNSISKMENLSMLKNLVTINLSANRITKIEGVIGLDMLKNLDLQGNIIPDTQSCEEILHLPSLESLDLKNNQINDHQNVIEFFSNLKSISALQLKGNPAIKNIQLYRKNMTGNMPKLNFLDDRIIQNYEKSFAEAFVKGGTEAE